MSVAERKLTWEDLKDLPESHGRTEIVDGELVMSPTPSGRHQKICTLLGVHIGSFVLEQGLGEFFSSAFHVILDEHVHYEPDLCFVSNARKSAVKENFIEGSPDLIIEVISESNRTHYTVAKFRHYEQYGVREYWLVDPREGVISVWHLEHGRYALLGRAHPDELVATRLLEGLHLDPAQVLKP